MKTKMTWALMALAAVCLTLTPALAAPCDANSRDRCNGSSEVGGFAGPHDWMLLVDDATKDNFDNMTVNEIRELRDEKISELDNMTTAQIEELHQTQMDKLNNMTLAEIKEMGMGHMGMMGDSMIGQDMMPKGPMGQEMNRAMSKNGRGPDDRR